MTDETPDALDDPVPFPNDKYEELAARATKAGRNFALRPVDATSGRKYVVFELGFPCGSGEKAINLINTRRVEEMLQVPFESYRLSVNHEAIIDTSTGRVEAALVSRTRPRPLNRGAVWELPGVDIDDDSPLKTGAELPSYATPTGWRLIVANDELEIEVSPKTAMFEATYPYPELTLKIQHAQGAARPRADRLLDEYAADFLLDLDLKYGPGLTLLRTRATSGKAILPAIPDTAPRFPSLRYSPEASALYWYGASAIGFPMLQYLAYYQVLEFFFSSFTRRAVVERLRSRLKDPRFDLRVDTDIDSLIDATKTAHAGMKNELDQLRHTLSDCITPEAVREFIRSEESLSNHFLTAKSKIRGTAAIRLDTDDDDLLRQLADRVYRVRNRIVHTKAGAEEIGLDLLLPSSTESNELWPEVELVKFLAQSALVHGAVPR